MDELRLVRPDASMVAEIAAYKEAMLKAGSSMDGCGSLSRHTPAEWLENCSNLASEETCPEGWVPAIQFVCVRVSDGRIVGMIDLRLRFNDFLSVYGGNIGYSVRPDERRKGYASRMLDMMLEEARDRSMDRVLVTCAKGNDASRRTIEAAGGVYENTVFLATENEQIRRYWIRIK